MFIYFGPCNHKSRLQNFSISVKAVDDSYYCVLRSFWKALHCLAWSKQCFRNYERSPIEKFIIDSVPPSRKRDEVFFSIFDDTIPVLWNAHVTIAYGEGRTWIVSLGRCKIWLFSGLQAFLMMGPERTSETSANSCHLHAHRQVLRSKGLKGTWTPISNKLSGGRDCRIRNCPAGTKIPSLVHRLPPLSSDLLGFPYSADMFMYPKVRPKLSPCQVGNAELDTHWDRCDWQLDRVSEHCSDRNSFCRTKLRKKKRFCVIVFHSH